jgi:ribosomal protein L7Ae-like RNA K-turn-binding protein
MKSELSPEIHDVFTAIHCRPSISVIMPFEPKMSAKAELAHHLKFAIEKVDREIRANYQEELADLVMQKLRKIIKNLNFNTFKKSIAIYVSPVFEKVLYLDIPMEEKIMVDGSFEIRDLLYAKKEMHNYLVLVLSNKWSKVFLGNYSKFVKVKSDVPDHIAAFQNDIPERVTNFSDPSYRKEVMMEKFLHHIDEGLKLLLHAYSLPVFVMGTKRTLGHFKAITKNKKSIVGYIHGNYEETTETELGKMLKPYINDWKKVKMEDIHNQMEGASDAGKLARGIKNVLKAASQNRGRLLVVEKNFMYPEEQQACSEVVIKPKEPYTKYSYIKDAVDEVIEKVLEQGGDVEFVDQDDLKEYDHIVLIQYY